MAKLTGRREINLNVIKYGVLYLTTSRDGDGLHLAIKSIIPGIDRSGGIFPRRDRCLSHGVLRAFP